MLENDFRYSLKKLFTRWLPIVSIISISVSIIYIFSVADATYVSSAFSPVEGGRWGKFLLVFLNATVASKGLAFTIFLCSLAHFLSVEVFSIIRLFTLRKKEASGILKMLFRFLVAQINATGVFVFSFLLIFAVSLAVSFLYGYADLQLNLAKAINGSITNDEEIIQLIQSSPSVVEVYDSVGEFGTVIAKRGLKKKDALTVYEGAVLPALVETVGDDTQGKSFFISSTNSIVTTNFSKGKTDKLIIALVFNRLKYYPNQAVVSAFERSTKPTVKFLDDQAFVQFATNDLLEGGKAKTGGGVYLPGTQTIYMKITPDKVAFNYLSNLLHESLHHYSKKGSDLPVFINEGITEYITLKSFTLSDYRIADITGYFREVQAIMALLEKIPEQEIIAAYFANDGKMFETTFKKAFPGVNYKVFLSKGDMMYKETFGETGPESDSGPIDPSSVRDLRTFLGLKPEKFRTFTD